MDHTRPWDEAPMRLLSDEEADRIREEIRIVRGPVTLKWIEQLLNDRELRLLQEVRLIQQLEEARSCGRNPGNSSSPDTRRTVTAAASASQARAQHSAHGILAGRPESHRRGPSLQDGREHS